MAEAADAERVEGTPPPLPVVPEGWSTGPPDFVGVGAQHCGTTWWWRQIAGHPGTSLAAGLHRKEIHFFTPLTGLERLSEEQRRGYERYFPRPSGTGPVGEWTPRYMFDPWSVPLLAQAAPEAKMLLMVRDPVKRYWTGVARERAYARERGEADIAPAMVEEQFERGLYWSQVQRVLDHFPRERVLVLQHERCVASFAQQLERTYAFLGLDLGFRFESERYQPRESPDRARDARESARLAEAYGPDAARLAAIAPEIDLSLWPSVAARA